VVSLFGTGGGLTTPASVNGLVTVPNASEYYPAPVLPVAVTIDGQSAQIVYVGAAPGLVAGVLQINVVVPANATQASYDQVVVTVGNSTSPTAVTMSVH
jgi:uncharacterized protein (TIGR03437 family)